LAYLLIEDERDIDEGVELAQSAVQFASENFFSLHALGWGYYKQGKYGLAVKTLQKAEDLVPKYDHYIRKHLEYAQTALAKQKEVEKN
jgi:cytochrome c-type biogenesis protein CcmH/NrfG